MLLALVERLRAAYPDATLSMKPTAPHNSQPLSKLRALGFYPKASLYFLGIEWGDAACLIPARLRRQYGLVLDREVDVIIDAAGFAYGDQWGSARSLELARTTRRWRRQGTKVILMPQAFGPFTDPVIRSAIKKSVDNADLVFPRDSSSYRYLTEVTGERDYIRQYPDFTNLIEGVAPEEADSEKRGVAIVPNYRMIDMTDAATSDSYVPFMIRCAEYLVELNAQPYVLVHEGVDDERIAEQISGACGGIPIVREDDPLKIKGILGASGAVVASRFHALVNALSQGVPSVATGWSHKYKELFDDYSFPEGVLSINDDFSNTRAMLQKLVDNETNQAISIQLLQRSAILKALSEAMWVDVQSVIDSCRCAPSALVRPEGPFK